MTVLIGLSISHDGTASVLRNGHHVYAIAEERLSRQKGHIGFPFRALAHLFEQQIVTPDEVDCVALSIDRFEQGKNDVLEFELADDVPYYDIMNVDAPDNFTFSKRYFNKSQTAEEVRDAFLARVRSVLDGHGCKAPIALVDHHLCHAASVAYSSTLNDPLVVTLDGEGDGLSGSISILEDGALKRLSAIPYRSSLGNIYSYVTRQLGYKIARHEGKITGLAAFGNPEPGLTLLWQAVSIENGEIALRGDLTDRVGLTINSSLRAGKFELYRPRPRNIAARIAHLSPEDQAAAVQVFLEQATCRLIAHWLQETGKRHVLLAGGVFANVKLNQRIAELDGVDDLFVFPNMGDGGTAVGAAQIAHAQLTGSAPPRADLPNVYLGPAPDRADIEGALAASTVALRVEEPEDLGSRVAQEIHDGRIVGWFQGGMEYGPRALGSRSIVARPTERHLNEEMNRRLSRTEFMPFAPSCLIEKAEEVFAIEDAATRHTAEFMTITYDVNPEWSDRIGAVVHVDNTARPQLVDKVQNPGYHAMISAYEALSGLPLVVNTSFNVHEEPIVCVPEQGLRALTDGVIDALAIGPFYVERDI